MTRKGLTEFPDAPIPVSIAGAGGIPAFPSLDAKDGIVSLEVHAERSQAMRRHPRGVRRLLQLALADRIKQARKQWPVQPT